MLEKTLITTKSGKSFPLHSEDWKFTTNFFYLFSNAVEQGYQLVIIAEEFGIEEGVVSEKGFIKKLEDICKVLEKDLGLKKNSITYTYCTGEKDEFRTIKYPGMLYEVASDKEIVLTQSILIGNTQNHQRLSLIGGLGSYYCLQDIQYLKL